MTRPPTSKARQGRPWPRGHGREGRGRARLFPSHLDQGSRKFQKHVIRASSLSHRPAITWQVRGPTPGEDRGQPAGSLRHPSPPAPGQKECFLDFCQRSAGQVSRSVWWRFGVTLLGRLQLPIKMASMNSFPSRPHREPRPTRSGATGVPVQPGTCATSPLTPPCWGSATHVIRRHFPSEVDFSFGPCIVEGDV